MADAEYRSLATLEAVPRILSIHEVPRCTSFAGSIREEAPALASRSTSPEPGSSPEMELRRVNSAKRLGDDIVHLDAEQPAPASTGLEDFPDFPREFDPLAASRSRQGSERRGVELDEIFSAFNAPEELHLLERQPMYVAKLPDEAKIQNSLDEIFPMPQDESPQQKQAQAPPRLVAELPQAFSLQPLSEDCTVDAPSIACPTAEDQVRAFEAPRARHLEASLAEPEARPAEARRPRHLEAALAEPEATQGSRRRGRSLDASIPKSGGYPSAVALDPSSSIDQRCAALFEAPPPFQEELSSAARRGRSTDDLLRGDVRQRAWEEGPQPPAPLPLPQDLLQLQPMQEIPLFQQVEELQLQPLQNLPPPPPPLDVQAKSDSAYQRYMADGDNLLAWDMPGQAYLKYCEANSKHSDLCAQKSGDAYRGMARSLSVGAGCPGPVPGLPATAEERLDLGMNMLELAVETGTSKLGDARSDPKLANLRQFRSARFAALMEQVPATGLDALAVAASAGVAAMAAVAGIQPVSLVPAMPVPLVPSLPEAAPTAVCLDPSQAPGPAWPGSRVEATRPAEVARVQELPKPEAEDSDGEQEPDEDDEEGEDDEDEESEDEGEKLGENDSEDEASDSDTSQADDDEGAASESDAEQSWAEALRSFFGW